MQIISWVLFATQVGFVQMKPEERRQAGGDVFGVDPLDPLPSGGPPAPVGSGSGGSTADGV